VLEGEAGRGETLQPRTLPRGSTGCIRFGEPEDGRPMALELELGRLLSQSDVIGCWRSGRRSASRTS
jgi:hypothetical protein